MLDLKIASSLTEVNIVCRLAVEELGKSGLSHLAFSVDLLLREFLNNAILHGNRTDEVKEVKVKLKIGRKWLKIYITDEGCGFNWRKTSRSIPADNVVSGRGLAIGSQYADRVLYNKRGNSVSLWLGREKGRQS